MIGINIKQTKLFIQAIKENKFGYLKLKEHEVLDNVLEEAEKSELFNKVWKEIEDYATKLVDEECKPQWDSIIESTKPLNEERNELEKKKASEEWLTEEEDKRYEEVTNLISAAMDEYQKVSDEANKKLEEFKEKTIEENQWACFFVEEDVYELVDKHTWWKVYETPLDKNNK